MTKNLAAKKMNERLKAVVPTASYNNGTKSLHYGAWYIVSRYNTKVAKYIVLTAMVGMNGTLVPTNKLLTHSPNKKMNFDQLNLTNRFVLYSPDMQEMVFFTVYMKNSTEPYWVGIRYLSTQGGILVYKKNFRFSIDEIKLVVEEARGLWYYLVDRDWGDMLSTLQSKHHV